MAVYAVFEPPVKNPLQADLLAHAERFRFVRDGFSWAALIFAPLWMLWHRLWLALIVYVAIDLIIAVVASLSGLAQGAVTISTVLLALLLGFEGATLRRRKLMWWRWRDLGVVVAKNQEEAERRFFDRWVANDPSVVAAAAATEAGIGPVVTPAKEVQADLQRAYDPHPDVSGTAPASDTPPGDRP
jgi:hypothetical protein